MVFSLGRLAAGIGMLGLSLFVSWFVVILAVGGICGSSGSLLGLGVAALMLAAWLPWAAGIYLKSLWALGSFSCASGPLLLAGILAMEGPERDVPAALFFGASVVVSFVSGWHGSRAATQRQ